ncbi:MAG: DUF456 family protein [Anaerolineae bacterium]|nr:DUF456 family protein [Anaerolineae bacterium]
MDSFTLLLQSIGFALAVVAIIIGIIGAFVPVLPGSLLVWLTLLVYTLFDGWKAVTPLTFIICTVICLVTGSATIWLTLLGAKTGGASGKALLLGVLGAIVGFFVFNLIGAIIGYALGIIVAEYLTHQDWRLALKASFGGLAGWGLATAIEAGGSLIVLLIFIWRVLAVA